MKKRDEKRFGFQAPEEVFARSPITMENSYVLYAKLQGFLARTEDCFWGGSISSYTKHQAVVSFMHVAPCDGRWYAIRWMPKLKEGWQRLTFEEFLRYYKLVPKEA